MHYQQHIFFCVNERDSTNRSCGGSGAKELFTYAKRNVRDLLMKDPQRVRINSAGCLGRCEAGPCVVVYPEGEWHRVTTQHEVDALLSKSSC
jgi:NADH:ubiquinone oxidoreductase subunit E